MRQHDGSLRQDYGWETTFEIVASQVVVDWWETVHLAEARVLLKETL